MVRTVEAPLSASPRSLRDCRRRHENHRMPDILKSYYSVMMPLRRLRATIFALRAPPEPIYFQLLPYSNSPRRLIDDAAMRVASVAFIWPRRASLAACRNGPAGGEISRIRQHR